MFITLLYSAGPYSCLCWLYSLDTPGMITSLLRGTVRATSSWLYCTEVEAYGWLFSRWYKPLPQTIQVSSCEGIPSSTASIRLQRSLCPVQGDWVNFEPISPCPSPHTIQSQISTFKVERFQKVVTPNLFQAASKCQGTLQQNEQNRESSSYHTYWRLVLDVCYNSTLQATLCSPAQLRDYHYTVQ